MGGDEYQVVGSTEQKDKAQSLRAAPGEEVFAA